MNAPIRTTTPGATFPRDRARPRRRFRVRPRRIPGRTRRQLPRATPRRRRSSSPTHGTKARPCRTVGHSRPQDRWRRLLRRRRPPVRDRSPRAGGPRRQLPGPQLRARLRRLVGPSRQLRSLSIRPGCCWRRRRPALRIPLQRKPVRASHPRRGHSSNRSRCRITAWHASTGASRSGGVLSRRWVWRSVSRSS